MSLNYIKKDLTTVEHGIIAHGVNCQNAMGAGVAKALYTKWPIVKEFYHRTCTAALEGFSSDQLLGYTHIFRVQGDIYVANGYTQEFYGNDGKRYADPHAIRTVLKEVVNFGYLTDLPVYIPRIGCGLGGLKWDKDVRNIIDQLSTKYPEVEIFVCDL